MKRPWFRARCYGWGWTPVSWQGWLVTLVFLVLVFAGQDFLFGIITVRNAPVVDAAIVLYTTAMVMGVLAVCWRTGERPRWRWGRPRQKGGS